MHSLRITPAKRDELTAVRIKWCREAAQDESLTKGIKSHLRSFFSLICYKILLHNWIFVNFILCCAHSNVLRRQHTRLARTRIFPPHYQRFVTTRGRAQLFTHYTVIHWQSYRYYFYSVKRKIHEWMVYRGRWLSTVWKTLAKTTLRLLTLANNTTTNLHS